MLCLPWPPPCSQPLDIEQRVPQILSIHASRLSCHSNVQMQLPSFPFGCYTIPGYLQPLSATPRLTHPGAPTSDCSFRLDSQHVLALRRVISARELCTYGRRH